MLVSCCYVASDYSWAFSNAFICLIASSLSWFAWSLYYSARFYFWITESMSCNAASLSYSTVLSWSSNDFICYLYSDVCWVASLMFFWSDVSYYSYSFDFWMAASRSFVSESISTCDSFPVLVWDLRAVSRWSSFKSFSLDYSNALSRSFSVTTSRQFYSAEDF